MTQAQTPLSLTTDPHLPFYKNKKKVIGIAVVCLLIALLAYALAGPVTRQTRYKNALQNLEQGAYDKAYLAFTQLQDYKDSPNMAQEARYQQARKRMDEGDYLGASLLFKQLDDYRDSQALAKDNRIEATYQNARHLYEEGKYEEASNTYKSLGNYKDSQDMAIKMQYQYAVQSLEIGEYDEALRLFTELGGYLDSQALVTETQYQRALSLMEQGEYSEAIRDLAALKDYKDTQAQLIEARYGNALYLLESKAYSIAASVFERLGNYRDSVTKLRESMYLYVTHYTNHNNFNQVTYGYLNALKAIDYEDSAAIYDELYRWKISLDYLNTDPENKEQIDESITKGAPYVHMGLILTGGIPKETIAIRAELEYSDVPQSHFFKEWIAASDSDMLEITWPEGLQGVPGPIFVKLFTRTTGALLGEFKILTEG